jgi:hypothetical protein
LAVRKIPFFKQNQWGPLQGMEGFSLFGTSPVSPVFFYLIQYRSPLKLTPVVGRCALAADVLCTKPADVASEDGGVSTTALDHRFVVAPIIRTLEPAMDHHVAGKAQVELIGFAGIEWFAVVLSMRVDDTLILSASEALSRARKHARMPLAI